MACTKKGPPNRRGFHQEKDVGFSKYRVSIGTGLRLKVPFLGAAPVALDLAIPILKEDGDEEQIFSFDIALPF